VKLTGHLRSRMSQRGINKKMVDIVFQYGKEKGEKIVLNKKDAMKKCAEIQATLKYLKKIMDKGGLVIVCENNSIKTSYRYE